MTSALNFGHFWKKRDFHESFINRKVLSSSSHFTYFGRNKYHERQPWHRLSMLSISIVCKCYHQSEWYKFGTRPQQTSRLGIPLIEIAWLQSNSSIAEMGNGFASSYALALLHPMCAHGEVSWREFHTPVCCMGSMARSDTWNPIRAEEVIGGMGEMTLKLLVERKKRGNREKKTAIRKDWAAEPQICKETQIFFCPAFLTGWVKSHVGRIRSALQTQGPRSSLSELRPVQILGF